MKRIFIVLILSIFWVTSISGQEETGTYKRDPGIYFGIGPGLYISSFLDREGSYFGPPSYSRKVSSEGQTSFTLNATIFFKFDLSSHFSIQPEIGFNPCSHEMDYVNSSIGNWFIHDTGDYKISYFNTQFSLLFSFNRGSRFRFFLGPFLNIPFGETCKGKETKNTNVYQLHITRVVNYDEMINCDLKPCLGISAGAGLNFNAWRMPLFLELKSGITLTETGIPPEIYQSPRHELFISVNLTYLLRL